MTSPTPYGADSDGDPVMMMESPEKQQQEQQPPRGGRGGGGGGERAGPTFSREDMLALNDHGKGEGVGISKGRNDSRLPFYCQYFAIR